MKNRVPRSCFAQLLFWERFPCFHHSFWLLSQGFCKEELPWDGRSPSQWSDCAWGAPRVQERVGFASSLSFKLGKLHFAVSRVTAGEMGSWTMWASPAKIPLELEISGSVGRRGMGSCQMHASPSLKAAVSPSSPGEPKGHFQLLMASWNCSQPALFPRVQLLSNPAVVGAVPCFMTEVSRSDPRCWCLYFYPCPFKKNVVILLSTSWLLIIFENLIPLKWLRALHKSPVASAEVFSVGCRSKTPVRISSSLIRVWFCRVAVPSLC